MSDPETFELGPYRFTLAECEPHVRALIGHITELEHQCDALAEDGDATFTDLVETRARIAELEGVRSAFVRYVQGHANCERGERVGLHETEWIVDSLLEWSSGESHADSL